MEIIEFRPEYAQAFYDLNEQWISTYFTLETKDVQLLSHPMEYIIKPGGAILFAVQDQLPVGTVALIPTDFPYDYELAKMCVHPDYQKRGIGTELTSSAIHKAKEMGASSIFLETNSKLQSAIRIYEKLGFTDCNDKDSPYLRCDRKMYLNL